MDEPNERLSYMEQEEYRHVFWSVYLLDKMVSCGRGRPAAILNTDCHVQLPCDEPNMRDGDKGKAPTLNDLLGSNTQTRGVPGIFGLTILAASILGDCARYNLQGRGFDEIPPWNAQSEYTKINSSLLLLESYLPFGSRDGKDPVGDSFTSTDRQKRHVAERLVFPCMLFHVCHCLINHPFLLRLRVKKLASKAPASFASHAIQSCLEHASQLSSLLNRAMAAGCNLNTSFYVYAAILTGTIHSMRSHLEYQGGGDPAPMLLCVDHSFKFLERMANTWGHASNMVY
jgi:hypothetical protein